MPNPIALLCLIFRTLRPTRSVHTSPYGYIRELIAELRRNRARRVRRYAETVPFVALRRAVTDWRRLDAALRSGTPLPEPWQR